MELNMKAIERFTLTLFSSIVLIVSVIFCIAIFGWIDIGIMGDVINVAITDSITSKILLVIFILFIYYQSDAYSLILVQKKKKNTKMVFC